MKTVAAALIQLKGTSDVEANLDRFESAVREAARRGARLVCGPEYVWFSGSMDDLSRLATTVPGPLTERFAALARRHSLYLCPGTIPERRENGAPYNTLLFFSPDGALRGTYRKRHLFRADIPGVVKTDERNHLSPGTGPAPVFETGIGRIGAAICYDLRFAEQFVRLALGGAEILIVPAAVTKPTGVAHWHLLCRTRAVETGCFLLGANRTGMCGEDIERFGHSLIVDPWGSIIAEAGEGEEVVCAELRAELVAETRARLRSVAHRVAGDSVPDPP